MPQRQGRPHHRQGGLLIMDDPGADGNIAKTQKTNYSQHNLIHMKKTFVLILSALVITLASCKKDDQDDTKKDIVYKAEIHTVKGMMKVEFFAKDAPNTVANFVKLSKAKFYDGLTFHRVIPNFVIQGGCPKGDGTGGPGYTIKCETDGGNQYHDRGVLSMAHAGKDTGGSQFFICHNRANTKHLDGVHTVFGKVVEGLDVIDLIQQYDVINKIVILEE
jgi:peptidyl-prolyl cis-trans isomerase B (cyclophilin B)